jgi:hypothetical protein
MVFEFQGCTGDVRDSGGFKKSLELFTYVLLPSPLNSESKSYIALNRITAMSTLEKC